MVGRDRPGPPCPARWPVKRIRALETQKDLELTITLEDSADGAVFAPIPAIAAMEVTGAGGAGAAAATRRLRLPPDVRRYLRAKAAVEAGGGNNTAKSLTLVLVF